MVYLLILILGVVVLGVIHEAIERHYEYKESNSMCSHCPYKAKKE